MIVSHQRRFVYFAVPKTATHSIRSALAPALGKQDWQQQALFGRDISPISQLAQIGHGHISLTQLLAATPDTDWGDYFMFGFVRNPYDRFLSVCAFLNRQSSGFVGQECDWMKRALAHVEFRKRVLVQPQIDLLSVDGMNAAIDFVGRYESLQIDVDHVFNQIQLPTKKLTQKNRSNHSSVSDIYDEELRQMTAEFYARDFSAFGYSTNLPD